MLEGFGVSEGFEVFGQLERLMDLKEAGCKGSLGNVGLGNYCKVDMGTKDDCTISIYVSLILKYIENFLII